MEWLKEANDIIGNYENVLGFIGLIVGVIGTITGIIGNRQLKEAKVIKQSYIDSNIKNLQNADNINNNYGLGYEDAKDIAKDEVNKEIEKLPKIHVGGTEPPKNGFGKDGDIYFQIEEKKND